MDLRSSNKRNGSTSSPNTTVAIMETNSSVDQLPSRNDDVVHELPKEESINVPNEVNPDGNLEYISDWIKRKQPKTACEVLRCSMMAYATKKESEHKAEMLTQGTPEIPPPTKRLRVGIDRALYEEIKQETLTQLRQGLLPQVNDGDANDSSESSEDGDDSSDSSDDDEHGSNSSEDSMEATDKSNEEDAQEEVKDLPMPLTFDFPTPGCTQVLNVQLIVPSVFLDLVAEELNQMNANRKNAFNIDDLIQLGRTKSELVSLNYDRMLRSMKWITAVQERCGIDWKEFPLIQENLQDPNFGRVEGVVSPRPQRPTCEVLYDDGSRKATIRLHKRN